MQRIRAEESLEVLQPELGTKPPIYHKNLLRTWRRIVAPAAESRARALV